MKRWKCCLGLFLIFSTSVFAAQSPASLGKIAKKTIPLNKIQNIRASGSFVLNIYIGAKRNYAILSGDLANATQFIEPGSSGTLDLSLNDPGVTANIYVSDLNGLSLSDMNRVFVKALRHSSFSLDANNVNQLNLSGYISMQTLVTRGNTNISSDGCLDVAELDHESSGTLDIQGIQSKKMIIRNSGSGRLILRGYANIEHIYQGGTGLMDLYWLGSQDTNIQIDSVGTVKIAGRTHRLVVNAFDSGRLYARYLRSDITFVHAYDISHVQVSALKELFMNAMGYGRIDYFGKPKQLYRHATIHGLIFPLT